MISVAPLPNKEAQAFWKDKVPMSPGEFRRLSDEAKTRAFAVSGIAKGDELATVMAAMQKAIDQGTTLADFKKDCAAVFEKRGWTGRRAWRIDNIFRTNIQTAYSVGRYKQMQEVKARRPYWQYSAVNDSRTRPSHAAMHGKVYPADHAFWNTWYPPNGFRCRCGVVTLSERDVREEKITVETADPTGKLIEPVDPVTGNKLPARLLMPDPGFAHNPGKNIWDGVVDASIRRNTGAANISGVAAGAPTPGQAVKWRDCAGLKTYLDYSRPAIKSLADSDIPVLTESLLPSGRNNEFYKAAFLARYGRETIARDVIGEPVILSLRSFMENKTPGAQSWKFSKKGHGETIPLLLPMIQNPFEIWLTPQDNGMGDIRLTRRYIGLWKTDMQPRLPVLAVYEIVDGVLQGVTQFIPYEHGKIKLKNADNIRKGTLLFKR